MNAIDLEAHLRCQGCRIRDFEVDILRCRHSFCFICLQDRIDDDGKFLCPQCPSPTDETVDCIPTPSQARSVSSGTPAARSVRPMPVSEDALTVRVTGQALAGTTHGVPETVVNSVSYGGFENSGRLLGAAVDLLGGHTPMSVSGGATPYLRPGAVRDFVGHMNAQNQTNGDLPNGHQHMNGSLPDNRHAMNGDLTNGHQHLNGDLTNGHYFLNGDAQVGDAIPVVQTDHTSPTVDASRFGPHAVIPPRLPHCTVPPQLSYAEKLSCERKVDAQTLGQTRFAPSFLLPCGDYVYASDRYNHMLHIMDKHLQYISSFSCKGSDPGQFNEPRGLAYNPDDNELLVADTLNHRLQIFTIVQDGQLEFSRAFGTEGHGRAQFIWLSDVAYRDGRAYVADFQGVKVFDTQGEYIRGYSHPDIVHVYGIALTPCGKVVVTDCTAHGIYLFDGNTVRKLGDGHGPLLGQFMVPLGVTVDSNGYILITDKYSFRVQVFTPDGRFYHAISLGVSEWPRDVTILDSGELAVATCVLHCPTGNIRLY